MSTNVLKVVINVAEMVRLSQNDRENKRILGSFGAIRANQHPVSTGRFANLHRI